MFSCLDMHLSYYSIDTVVVVNCLTRQMRVARIRAGAELRHWHEVRSRATPSQALGPDLVHTNMQPLSI